MVACSGTLLDLRALRCFVVCIRAGAHNAVGDGRFVGWREDSGKPCSWQNLVGAFYQPRLVYACLETLRTLPSRELSCGLAEILKIGLIAEPSLFDDVSGSGEAICAGERSALGGLLRRAVQLKAAVVAQDELESGWRAVLNLGHTVAHGLEAALGPTRISHGEAVAIGLVAETRWALAQGLC